MKENENTLPFKGRDRAGMGFRVKDAKTD